MEGIQEFFITRKGKFDAAHQLPNYNGPCANIHGHTWHFEITCAGSVNPYTGMLVDFKELKGFCKQVEQVFDHKCLNSILDNPTAENIVLHMAEMLEEWCQDQQVVVPYSIKLWETENSCITFVWGKEHALFS